MPAQQGHTPQGEANAAAVIEVLNRLRGVDADAPFGAALQVAEDFVSAAEGLAKDVQDDVIGEIRALAGHIARTRAEIAALQPNKIKNNQLPQAGRELEAIVQHTETATGTIMAAAEEIMGADPSDAAAYQETVNDKVMEIFEACSFQDITGQRIEKVIRTITYIETRMSRLLEAAGIEDADFATDEEQAEEARAEENLLHGPQLVDEALNQSAVDDVFSQDDIDALFD
ncbi:MAG: protein phosphatase CheZ [Pseudomonadota bacterium]